jgi:hypothetical protein
MVQLMVQIKGSQRLAMISALRLSPALPLEEFLAGVPVDPASPGARPWPDGVIEYLTG